MTTSTLARRLQRLESKQYSSDPLIVVLDITEADLLVLTGKDEAAAAVLCARAGLAGPGYDQAQIVAVYINIIGGPWSWAAVLQEAHRPPPRGGWPRKPHIELSYYHSGSHSADVEAPGGIRRPDGWVRPVWPYRRFVSPGVGIVTDPDEPGI